MRPIVICAAIILAVSSCSSKFDLQKRRYTKGYYLASVKGKKETEAENRLQRPEKNVAAQGSFSAKEIKQKEVDVTVTEHLKPVTAEGNMQHRSSDEPLASASTKIKKHRLKHLPSDLRPSAEKNLTPPYYHQPPGGGGGTMGVWGVIGLISTLISLAVVFIYLFVLLEILTLGTMTELIIIALLLLYLAIAAGAAMLMMSGGV